MFGQRILFCNMSIANRMKIFVRQRIKVAVHSIRFFTFSPVSYVFTFKHFYPLGYLYDITQLILWCEHAVLSAKHKPRNFCTFLSAKTLLLLGRTLRTTYTVKHNINA